MLKKRSVTIRGHATSYSVEDEFQEVLLDIARRRGKPVASLVAGIDAARPPDTNLSSAIRLFVLSQVRQSVGD
ncbi:MAG: ribbon-helix-helix domain-containing protein [Pseudomonadota bacterium]|nr:ribbon-helix-helix domain-containing protein [Pseudomonadota bacterium]